MPDTIVIDFGTSRTKAAFYNPTESGPDLIKLGREDTVPSVFFVEKTGNILFGDAAQDVLEDQKVGARNVSPPIRDLKLDLKSKPWRRGKGYSAAEFLTPLFKFIRERAAGVEGRFDKTLPTKVILTTTKFYETSDREMLESAAREAGFKDITLKSEPEAVAEGWATTAKPDRTDVIVLDCGGGTLDWTYLHRDPNGDFRVSPKLPGDAAQVGGSNVDQALAGFVNSKLVHDSRLLDRVRGIKERFCNGTEDPGSVQIGNQSVELTNRRIEAAIRTAFIKPACKAIEPFIKQVKAATGRGNPAILLVGGSAKLRGLKDALESEFDCEVNSEWTDAEYAPTLGAVPIPNSGQTPDSGQTPEERPDSQVARHFREVAKLIEPQDSEKASEIEFVIGEETHRVVPGLLMSGNPAEKLRAKADKLDQGSLRLMVLGGVSTGKSTLINAMLGQDSLPTGPTACTCVPIEIVYGLNGNRATIVERGGKQTSISVEDFKKRFCFKPAEGVEAINDSQRDKRSQRPERLKDVLYVRLEVDSTLGKEGICFIDSLGIDADELSDKITRELIRETDTILVVVENILPPTTANIMKDFAKKKVTPEASGYEHIFCVLKDPSTWVGDNREEAEESLRTQLARCNFDDYDSHVFTVNARDAFYARTNPQDQAKLQNSGIVELEKALRKFKEGPGRISVTMQTAMDTGFLPVFVEARDYISNKQAYLNEDIEEAIKKYRETIQGVNALREIVNKCQAITQKFLVDTRREIVSEYRQNVEEKLSDENFKAFWEENDLGEALSADTESAAASKLKREYNEYTGDRLSSVAEDLEAKFLLPQMMEEELKPTIQEFFETLNETSLYRASDKEILDSEEEILDSAQRLKIRVEDTLTDDIGTLSISLKKKVWDLWIIPTFGLSALVKGVDNSFKEDDLRDSILEELNDDRAKLTRGNGRNIRQIVNSINKQARDFNKVLVTNLSAEIQTLEKQLAQAENQQGDTAIERERLEKIDSLLKAKCEEISQAVFGRVLNDKELKDRFKQAELEEDRLE